MSFLGNLFDKGRGGRLLVDARKMDPTIRGLIRGPNGALFCQAVWTKWQEAAWHLSNMTPKGQKQYGMQLQIEGFQAVDLDMVEGASNWVVGALIESSATPTPECQEIAIQLRGLVTKAEQVVAKAERELANRQADDELPF